MRVFKVILTIFISYGLIGCGKPKEEFNDFIVDKGYIPYTTPLSEAGVGTIVKGNAQNLRLAVRPQRCLPDEINGKETYLRWAQETVIPNEYSEFEVGFNADLSPLTFAANPLIQFNLDYSKAKYVSIKFEGATIESMDEISFGAFYSNNMSDECVEFIENYPFIVQALKIEKMSFEFKNKSQGRIYLNAGNISDIVNIGLGVSWRIVEGKTLEINSPKYIGYQVGRLRPQDNGRILLYASKTSKDGSFKYDSIGDNLNNQTLKTRSVKMPLKDYNEQIKINLYQD